MERQQELAAALRDIFDLIDTGQLVRDTSFDNHPGWVNRMTNFVMTLARAKALLEPDPKEPAVAVNVIPFQCGTARAALAATEAPGGCVSVPERSEVAPTLEFERSISEQLQEDLEPISDHGKRYCI